MKILKVLFLSIIILVSYDIHAQVTISNDGSSADGSAMLEIKSTEKGLLPPRLTLAQRNAISNPANGLMIYNTDTNKPNYYNGTEWVHFDGSTAEPSVGVTYEGGIIFYIFEPGDDGWIAGEIHGLIYATDFTTPDIYPTWNTGLDIETEAIRSWIGSGQDNTNDIIDVQGPGVYAASICQNAVHNGFDDWFLPSKGELQEMKDACGFNGHSWSSTEIDLTNAWGMHTGNFYSYDKDGEGGSWYLPVVPIRSF